MISFKDKIVRKYLSLRQRKLLGPLKYDKV